MATYVPAGSVDRYQNALGQGIKRSGLQLVRDRGFLFVLGVAPGSPGDDVGLESGDIVSKLNGRSTRLLPLWEARVTLGGEEGTTVAMEVLRQGQTMEFEPTLREFEIEEPSVEIREGVAIVQIGQFEPGLVERLETLLSTSEVTASGRLILDLRNIAGGNLDIALAAADLFVDGALGELRERTEVVETFSSSRERIWNGRLVLLTNRGSQGASEVFTVVLKQLAEAVTVGRATFGHAGRSASRTLSGGGEFFYTDAFFVAPDGTMLNETLAPDFRVTGSSRRLGDADRSLDELIIERALEVAFESEAPQKKAA